MASSAAAAARAPTKTAPTIVVAGRLLRLSLGALSDASKPAAVGSATVCLRSTIGRSPSVVMVSPPPLRA